MKRFPAQVLLHTHRIRTFGQITIFHQPRFLWNKGNSRTKPPFGVRSCEVVWGCYNLTSVHGICTHISRKKTYQSHGPCGQSLTKFSRIFGLLFGCAIMAPTLPNQPRFASESLKVLPETVFCCSKWDYQTNNTKSRHITDITLKIQASSENGNGIYIICISQVIEHRNHYLRIWLDA